MSSPYSFLNTKYNFLYTLESCVVLTSDWGKYGRTQPLFLVRDNVHTAGCYRRNHTEGAYLAITNGCLLSCILHDYLPQK